MELYILRHGESMANVQQLVCGSCDYPLSVVGVKQADQICRYLDRKKFTRIYSSPLTRAIDTISSLQFQVPINIEDQLVELNTGQASSLTLSEWWARDSRYIKPWLFPDLRYPGGECFREMVNRISHWFEAALKRWQENETILIVGHEGTLRAIFLCLFNLDLTNYPDFEISNCDHLYFKIQQNRIVHYEHVMLQDLCGDY